MATITRIQLTALKVNPQARKQFDELELRRLGESLKAKQLQPVVCLPDGTLICGERRFRAAELIGLESLEAKFLDEQLTESQVKVYQLTENLQRADLSGPEKWQACVELKRLNGWSNKELAEHLHLDPSSITRILSPSDCIPAVQEKFLAGECGYSDCYAISRFPESEQAAMLARKLGGATRDELEIAGQKCRKGHANTARVPSIKVALPRDICVVINGKGVDLELAIEALGEALKQLKKALADGLDPKTAQAVWRDKSKSGS